MVHAPRVQRHQTGLTVDLLPIGRSSCTINDCIDETPQGAWLAKQRLAPRLLLRYEHGRTSADRHRLRALALPLRRPRPLARAYHDGGWHTYEEFLGRPAAPTY